MAVVDVEPRSPVRLLVPGLARTSALRLDTLVKDAFSLLIVLSINVLESFSYGILLFPPVLFHQFYKEVSPLDGIQMYVQCTAIAQLAITWFTSFRATVAAGMMIENIPFMNTMAMHVFANASKKEYVLPTILVCYSSSTLLIAVSFYCIYKFKWSTYFKVLPQYLLDGLLAGIGVFMIVTAIQVTQHSFQVGNDQHGTQDWWSRGNPLLQVIVASVMGLSIFIVNLFLPSFQFAIPLLTVAFIGAFWFTFRFILGQSLSEICQSDWFFKVSLHSAGSGSMFGYYSLFSIKLIEWKLVFELFPVFLASTIFGLLHVPINIPAFAWGSGQMEKYDFNLELRAHSISNLLCSLISFVPNYMVYSTSTLFYRLSGSLSTGRWKGIVLAGLTLTIPYFGIELLGVVPKAVLSGFMFYLGIDLVWYAGVIPLITISSWLERTVITSIVAVCNIWGFSLGLLLGAVETLVLICYRVNWFNVKIIQHLTDEEDQTRLSKSSLIFSHCLLLRIVGNLSFLNTIAAVEQVCALLQTNCTNQCYVVFDMNDSTLIDTSFVTALLTNSVNFDAKFCIVKRDLQDMYEGELLCFSELHDCLTCIERELVHYSQRHTL